MRIVAISDTHNRHHDLKIPDGDVLVHAGDITNRGGFERFARFNEWLDTLPHKDKVVIPGNHDIEADSMRNLVKETMTNCHFLVGSGVTINGVKFWGVPWTPSFYPETWVFNVDRDSDQAEAIWDAVPSDTDVIVCHGPPRGFGDLCPDMLCSRRMVHVGCDKFLETIQRIRPKLVICGHIHEGYGKYSTDFGTIVVNASTCTGGYIPKNPPMVIDL